MFSKIRTISVKEALLALSLLGILTASATNTTIQESITGSFTEVNSLETGQAQKPETTTEETNTVNLQKGLKGYWRFDNPEVSRGYSLEFDGQDDYLSVPNDGDFNEFENGFTWMVWFKGRKQSANYPRIIDFGDTTLRANGEKGNFRAWFTTNGSRCGYVYADDSTLGNPDEGWHRSTVVYNESQTYLYVDGELQDQGSCTDELDTGYNLAVGAENNGGANFNGSIDQVKVFNRVISSSRIEKSFSGKSASRRDLVLLQKFNEGPEDCDLTSGTSCLRDSSGAENNATPYGFDDNHFDTGSGWVNETPINAPSVLDYSGRGQEGVFYSGRDGELEGFEFGPNSGWESGRIGEHSLNFDGNDDYVRLVNRTVGSTSASPARGCYEIHLERPSASTGVYWIDPDGKGGISPFQVRCDMEDDGGGWIEMQLSKWNNYTIDNSVEYRMFRADHGIWGGWNKGCGDEEGFYASLPDSKAQRNMEFNGSQTNYYAYDVLYENPATGENFTDGQLTAIRSYVAQLSETTRMVATTADADAGDYAGEDSYGHETWVYGEGDTVTTQNGFELTSETDTDSGDTIGYLWSTNPEKTETVTCDTPSPELDNEGMLPRDLIIPEAVVLGVHTGGGSSWGYEKGTFLVRGVGSEAEESRSLSPFNRSWSVSLWLRANGSTPSSDETVIGKTDRMESSKYWWNMEVSGGSGEIGADFDDDQDRIELQGTEDLTDGEWKHVAVSREKGESYRLYVNGDLVDKSSDNGDIQVGTGALTLGAFNDGGTVEQFIDGRIDDLRIFNRSLSSSEVKSLSSGSSVTGDMIGRWNFEAGDRKTAYDTSSLSRDGILGTEGLSFTKGGGHIHVNHDGMNISESGTISAWLKSGKASWKYRKPITITENSGSTLSNYQIKVEIDTASLITGGRMRRDCGDMRFYTESGTALDYWIESGCGESNTEIWIEVPTISANSQKTIYMYYGRPSAGSKQNGYETFLAFDDFNDGNRSRWVQKGGSSHSGTISKWEESDSLMEIHCDNDDCVETAWEGENLPTDGVALAARSKCEGTNTDGEHGIVIAKDNWDRSEDVEAMLIRRNDNDIWKDEGTSAAFDNSCGEWYQSELRDSAGSAVEVWVDGAQYGTTQNDVNVNDGDVGFEQFKGNIIYDWIYYRKFVPEEPGIEVGDGTVIGVSEDGSLGLIAERNSATGSSIGKNISGKVSSGWKNVVSTYDGSSHRLYVNGELIKQKSVTGSFQSGSANLFIGDIMPFSGKVDEVRIYNRSLNQREIDRLAFR